MFLFNQQIQKKFFSFSSLKKLPFLSSVDFLNLRKTELPLVNILKKEIMVYFLKMKI